MVNDGWRWSLRSWTFHNTGVGMRLYYGRPTELSTAISNWVLSLLCRIINTL